jgi:2-polyprenyl-6-hydroxyphenyl methylase/3-demethylubiquinone-9 3-methyltransferase
MEMLEHVPDPFAIVEAASRLVKPNGFVFFSTINRNVKSFLSAIVGAEYILNLLPKGTHHYQKFIRPSELTQWAEKNNLVLRGLKGITYHQLRNQFEMTDSVDVNYLIYFQKNAE